MLRFAVARTGQAVLSLWAALTAIFVVVTQLPGDPVRGLFGAKPPPPEVYARIQNRFGLDQPLWEQYRRYLRSFLIGDLGNSFPVNAYGQARVGPPITQILASTIPVSAVLVLGAVALQIVIGIAVGATNSDRRSPGMGAGVYVLAVLLVSTPVLVAGYLLRTVFTLELDWLPANGIVAGLRSYILPLAALSALPVGHVILLTRSEVQETMASTFIRAARAKGLRRRRILAIHALRPSLIPVVAYIAASFGQLVVGLIVIEGVFKVPGVGGAIFQAMRTRDRSLLIGLISVVIIVVLVANAIADILTALLDARLRLA